MKPEEIYYFLKPSLEQLTDIEKKELCKLITGSDTEPFKDVLEEKVIELPPELPKSKIAKIETLFEELMDKAYNPVQHSYSFKEANEVIKEYFQRIE